MRERLSGYYQETLILTARFVKYGKTDDGSNVVCLAHIRLEDRWLADHVWIHRSKLMKNLALKSGDIVEFEGRVYRYARNYFVTENSDLNLDYGLEKIRDFKVIQRRCE